MGLLWEDQVTTFSSFYGCDISWKMPSFEENLPLQDSQAPLSVLSVQQQSPAQER